MNRPARTLLPYLKTVEELCRLFDRDTLIECIVALARQVKPENRTVFLENLRTVSSANAHRDFAASFIEEARAIGEMDNLRKQIEERLNSIEDLSGVENSDEDRHVPAWLGNGRKVVH